MPSEAPPASGMMTIGRPWAEEIKAYEAAKSALPWKPEQQTPVKYVTRYDKSREERQYDLVLGKFRDAEREVSLQRQEYDKHSQGLENARAKQLRTIERFDLINHAEKYPGAHDPRDRQPSPHPNRKKNAAGYNIITNVPAASTADAATQSPTRRPTRTFNILTNKYHDRDEDQTQTEAARAKQLAAQKFFKTHDFDPVRATYFDYDKEAMFLRERDAEQQVHGKDRVLKLPPREQFSEGRLYNILNQNVINQEKLASATEHDKRALNKIQKTAFEQRMRVVGELQQSRETELCLNRYAHERNTQAYVHGYDPISNESFVGRDAKPTMPTRTHARFPAWQVLQDGIPVNSKTEATSPAAIRQDSHSVKTAPPTQRRQSNGNSEQKANILVINDHPSMRVRTGGFTS